MFCLVHRLLGMLISKITDPQCFDLNCRSFFRKIIIELLDTTTRIATVFKLRIPRKQPSYFLWNISLVLPLLWSLGIKGTIAQQAKFNLHGLSQTIQTTKAMWQRCQTEVVWWLFASRKLLELVSEKLWKFFHWTFLKFKFNLSKGGTCSSKTWSQHQDTVLLSTSLFANCVVCFWL